MPNKILKQSGTVEWLGALQVQVSNSMFYMSMVSTGMMILTFWYTAGYQIQQQYLKWLTLGWFIAFVVVLFGLVMFIDYKWILPSRMAFVNKQAYKHENQAMDEILAIHKEIKEIEKKLGIV
jgi:hypothetical protein